MLIHLYREGALEFDIGTGCGMRLFRCTFWWTLRFESSTNNVVSIVFSGTANQTAIDRSHQLAPELALDSRIAICEVA